MNPCTGEEYFYKLENILLISTRCLRKEFISRWKEETGKEWGSEEGQGKEIIQGMGERLCKSLQPQQKIVIYTGYLSEWDLPIFSLVLQNFWRKNQLKKYEAIKALTRLKTDLALNQKHKLSREEYNQRLKIFTTSLRALSCKEQEIKMIINRAGVTSSAAALKFAQDIYERAKGHMDNGELDRAIELYGEAINISSLLPVHQADALVKRSECFVEQAAMQTKNGITEYDGRIFQRAASDAQNALEQDEFNWKAHQIIAHWHRKKNNLEEAIFHFERALQVIAPLFIQSLQNELEACRALAQSQKQKVEENSSPKEDPMSDKAIFETFELSKNENDIPVKLNLSKVSDAERINRTLSDMGYLSELFLQEKKVFSDFEKSEIVNIMYNCAISDYDACALFLHVDIYDRLKSLLHQLFKSKCAKKVVPNEEEMKIRFAHISFSFQSHVCVSEARSALKEARKGLRLYPDNPHYYWLVSKMLTKLEEHLEGQRVVEQGLEKFPNNWRLRYENAANLIAIERTEKQLYKMYDAYDECLEVIPYDNWMVPNICYIISLRYIGSGVYGTCLERSKKARIMMKYYYDLGCEAEKRVHPFFRPEMKASSSANKQFTEKFLANFEPENTSSPTPPDKNIEMNAESTEVVGSETDENFYSTPSIVQDTLPDKTLKQLENAPVCFLEVPELPQNEPTLSLTDTTAEPVSVLQTQAMPLCEEASKTSFNEAEQSVSNNNTQNPQPPPHDKLANFLVKLPLYIMALCCFAQGNFVMAFSLIFYIEFVLHRAYRANN